jgi:serine/threonine protein kinase
MEHAIMCPQCNAPLAPHPFARSIVCAFCGATVRLDETTVSASLFHEAYRLWNSPESYQFSSWVSLGDHHWALDQAVAAGELSDVFTGRRARWPTELVIMKLLRDPKDLNLFENEWDSLQDLQRSEARGAATFLRLLPQPVIHGVVSAGTYTGRRLSIFRREIGFRHTLADVIRVYPQGIPPRASIWLWRRILETLTFIHDSGMIHGAVLPAHLLIQDNDHGVRLIDFSCAGQNGGKLLAPSPGFASYYAQLRPNATLTASLDLWLSARCITAALGGDPAKASLPAVVPAPLAGIIQRVARSDPAKPAGEDAWAIREELGDIAKQIFGAPQFNPIVMPD